MSPLLSLQTPSLLFLLRSQEALKAPHLLFSSPLPLSHQWQQQCVKQKPLNSFRSSFAAVKAKKRGQRKRKKDERRKRGKKGNNGNGSDELEKRGKKRKGEREKTTTAPNESKTYDEDDAKKASKET